MAQRFTLESLLAIQVLVRQLPEASDETAKEIRGGLRSLYFRVDDLKGRGGEHYSLVKLQRHIDAGFITIKVE